MACRPIIIDGKAVGTMCGVRVQRCGVPGCRKECAALCDWKLRPPAKKATCSARLCAEHTTKPASDKDLCPPHAEAWRKWKEGRNDSR